MMAMEARDVWQKPAYSSLQREVVAAGECSNEDKCVVKVFMDQGHTFIRHNLHNVTNVQGQIVFMPQC